MSDLENGFDAKAVKYFFAHWNASTDEKMRLRAWMAPILNNEILSHDVLEGYTIREIAQVLRKPESTVKSDYYRGMNQLKERTTQI